MIKRLIYDTSLIVLLIAGCKSASKYAIDEVASIPIDTNMLGIWKAVEDTDKANFIVIQNYADVLPKDDYKGPVTYAHKNNTYYYPYPLGE